MKIRIAAFLLPFFVLLPVFPGGAVTITPAYDPEERSATPRPTGFFDATPLTPEQRAEIGPSGNDAATLGEARRNALEHAFGLIEDRLGGNIDITVDVKFTDELDSTPPNITLASAGPCLYQSSLLPRRQTLYPSALAKAIRPNDERLRGSGGPCSGKDIIMQFNGGDNVPFYYGFDEIPAGDPRFEFVSVVLHETFHGLGFFERIQQDGSWRSIDGTNNLGEKVTVANPSIYDEQLYSEADREFVHRLSEPRRAAAIVSEDGLSWYGRTSEGCSYGRLLGERDKDAGTTSDGKPLLHAPSSFQDGSSVSHFHVSVNPDDILEPRFPVTTRDMTLALALLKDLGWRVSDPSIPASCGGTPDDPEEPREPPEEPPTDPSSIDTSAPVDRDEGPDPFRPGAGNGDGENQNQRVGGSSGGCAVASDGDFGKDALSGGLLLILSVLASGVFGGRRPEKRRARGSLSAAGLRETTFVYTKTRPGC